MCMFFDPAHHAAVTPMQGVMRPGRDGVVVSMIEQQLAWFRFRRHCHFHRYHTSQKREDATILSFFLIYWDILLPNGSISLLSLVAALNAVWSQLQIARLYDSTKADEALNTWHGLSSTTLHLRNVDRH